MPIYSYTIPETVSLQTKISIYNERNEVIYIIKKTPHRVVTLIVHLLFTRSGLPFCYQTFTKDNVPVYKIDCVFTGFRYTLLDFSTQQIIPINNQRQHVIDKIQTIALNGGQFRFEKDYTCKGILTCNGEVFATITNLDNLNVTNTNRIAIEAINDETAALAAVMYQTFIYWGV